MTDTDIMHCKSFEFPEKIPNAQAPIGSIWCESVGESLYVQTSLGRYFWGSA